MTNSSSRIKFSNSRFESPSNSCFEQLAIRSKFLTRHCLSPSRRTDHSRHRVYAICYSTLFLSSATPSPHGFPPPIGSRQSNTADIYLIFRAQRAHSIIILRWLALQMHQLGKAPIFRLFQAHWLAFKAHAREVLVHANASPEISEAAT